MNAALTTPSPRETERLGALFSRRLKGGEALLLCGALGSGKTCFVRGLVGGLGGDARQVRSPSYNILRRYEEGRLSVAHFDAYFVREEGEFARTGLGEFLDDGDVAVVEWADRFPVLLKERAILIRFEHEGPQLRRMTFQTTHPELCERCAGLRREFAAQRRGSEWCEQ